MEATRNNDILIAILRNDSEQMVNNAPLTNQHILVGQWACRSANGKATVGLASLWPCVTDFSGLTTYGLREMRHAFGIRHLVDG